MAYPSCTNTFADGTGNIIYAAQVNQNFTDIINGVSDGLKDINVKNDTVNGNLSVLGNTSLGNATSDTFTIASDVVTLSSGTAKVRAPILKVGITDPVAIKIVSGTLTPVGSYCVVESETGASDDLNSIVSTNFSGETGSILIIQSANGHTITVKNNAVVGDTIFCVTDRVLTSDSNCMALAYRGGGGGWIMLNSYT